MKTFHTYQHHPVRQVLHAAGLTLTVVLFTACAAPTPKLDARVGESLENAKRAQKIEPTPAQRRAPAPAVTSAEVQRAVIIQTTPFPGAGVPGAAAASGQTTGMPASTSGTTTFR